MKDGFLERRINYSISGGRNSQNTSQNKEKQDGAKSTLFQIQRKCSHTLWFRLSRVMQEYVAYQQQHGHPNLKVEKCGLHVSLSDLWLAANPDDW